MSESLIEEFEAEARDARSDIEGMSDALNTEHAEGQAEAFEEAARLVRNVLTEKEARVLRRWLSNRDRDMLTCHWDSPVYDAIEKCFTALTKPEPEKLWRWEWRGNGIDLYSYNNGSRAPCPDWSPGEWVEFISTDNGKTWERAE